MVAIPTSLVTACAEVDDTLHQKSRLAIMAALAANGETGFGQLKEILGLTDGNLSTHLSVLERKEYVEIEKSFRGRRPHTVVRSTEKGRLAFAEYLAALGRIVAEAKGCLGGGQ
ncbi:MAG TPA: transcriptional regulator [Fimbriimonadaceae bacterium]|nr:transcriptional regulator [Fimbriimonadaceae bacterium]